MFTTVCHSWIVRIDQNTAFYALLKGGIYRTENKLKRTKIIKIIFLSITKFSFIFTYYYNYSKQNMYCKELGSEMKSKWRLGYLSTDKKQK